eukprot:3800313-Pleurochrysis_carterae.AAC.1
MLLEGARQAEGRPWEKRRCERPAACPVRNAQTTTWNKVEKQRLRGTTAWMPVRRRVLQHRSERGRAPSHR